MSSDNEEHFKVLRKVGEQDAVSQRKLSKDLGMSLGKINYCLKNLLYLNLKLFLTLIKGISRG